MISSLAWEVTRNETATPALFPSALSSYPADNLDTGFQIADLGRDPIRANDQALVINEFLYRPATPDKPRFVELLNTGEHPIDLSGWSISRHTGQSIQLSPFADADSLFLPPGAKVVVSEPGLVIKSPVLHIESPAFTSLSRLGDAIVVKNREGTTIDSLFYSPEWGGNRDGISLERRDPQGASADSSNWKEHPDGHSAGVRNVHYDPFPEPVQALFARKIDKHHIKIYFSRFIRSANLDKVYVNDRGLSLVPEEQKKPEKAASSFLFYSATPLQRTFKTIQVSGIMDYAGRIAPDHALPLAMTPRAHEIIINEIMYQPRTDRYGLAPDQSEYLEIYNRSNLALQIDQLYLHDMPDKNSHVHKLIPNGLQRAYMLPDSYAVFYADTASSLKDSRIYRSFRLSPSSGSAFFPVYRQTMGFSNSGDQIYLADRHSGILDSLWYDPSWHHPGLVDTRGISLERIHPHSPSQLSSNWASSASDQGGSPGAKNTVTSSSEPVPSLSELTLEPNPFFPLSKDSYAYLAIRYTLRYPDYLLHVRIFDRAGRLVRTLAEGMPAGLSGTLHWDGRSDNRVMNRAGIYIVHLEASHSGKGRRISYREVAVLAR